MHFRLFVRPFVRPRKFPAALSTTLFLALGVLAPGLLTPPAAAVDIDDTRLLSEPAVSDTHIAFAYAGDLWVADRDGGTARRLTSFPAREGRPRFSPDGQWIAFSGYYDGNVDVFLVPAAGGVPQRLTWHPGPDIVQGFTPDGSAVLFTSPRSVYTRRYQQLFTVPVEGGFPTQLPIPFAFKATFSPDGSKVAYVPLPEAFRQWKNYRGGTTSRIWLYDRGDNSVTQIPQPEGRCNDTDPMWLGDTVYFVSDRAGEFNLFAYDTSVGTATASVRQLTHHDDFPILAASDGGGRIVYEQAGWLHLFDPAAGTGQRLQVGVAADLPETRPRFEAGGDYIRNADISPSGARAVIEFRGEIVTVPAEKGDPRNLTDSVGAHERSPAWSPDGRWIAYVSDAPTEASEAREYRLHIAPQDGRGEVRIFELGGADGAGFYEDLKWSPDSTKISFSDNSWAIYILDVESGEVTKVDQEILYGPIKTTFHSWSPDSRWLAYTKNTDTYFQQVHLYSLEDGSTHVLTEGLADVGEPVFDRSGKYLWFTASTDAGPVRQWFAMSNADMELSNELYLAVLPADEPSPLAAESDEEKSEEEAKSGEKGEPGDEDKSPGKKAGKKGAPSKSDDGDGGGGEGSEVPQVEIDLDGLHHRIVAVPVGPARITDLQPGPEGQLYYLKRGEAGGLFGNPPGSLTRYDLGKRKEETLLEGVRGFRLSADGKKVLLVRPGSWQIVDAGSKIEPGSGEIPVDDIQVKIDPRAEWAQIFDEAWRINRDYFYDPNMHGADWPAMKEKYAVFLPHLANRQDLNDVLQWMSSELTVGHHRVGGGDRLWETEDIEGGLLGADYEIHDGRYRFAKVYGGLNWNPDLRAPLTEPGVNVQADEYLLAVDGEDLRPPENLFAHFENTADKIVEITVGPNADGTGSRTVQVVPVESELSLRNRDWVEGNLKKVTEATDGRVAYVYVPNTTNLGHVYFKRYFFPQADRDAIIVDERHNGGGQVADYYLDILRRPYISHWAMRYGKDLKTPLASIQGPKVMLIDETAGSGGDLLPWMFRKLKLGTLIGRPTWGGLVGILGFPTLMDGGGITAPNLAIWTEDGFVVENVGVPPDIEVEQWPKDVIEGHDPQLEKAIEVVLEQLEAHPPKQYQKPPYPIRVRH